MTLTTLEFLRLVVPEQGWKIVSIDRGQGRWQDLDAGQTHEEMAATIEANKNKLANIYHANGGFVKSTRRGEEKTYRTAKSVVYLKALWLDLDVQKESGESYDSQAAAFQAFKGFVKASRIPHPNLLVSSGKGIHIYWCFDTDVDAARWQLLANALKDLTQAHDLLTDAAVTADKARVLRPVGTLWRDMKGGTDQTYPVRLLGVNSAHPTYPVELLEQVLLKPQAGLTRPTDMRTNEAAQSGAEYADESKNSDASLIVEHCGQLRRFQDSGNLPYEIWRLCIGVLKFARNGKELAHAWSANGFAHYDPVEVENKFESWNASGATTCAEFKRKDPAGPCATCALRCNSPISIGYGGRPEPVVYRNDDGETEVFKPEWFPDEARIKDGHLEMLMDVNIGTKKAPEPIKRWLRAAEQPFYLTSLAVNHAGELESDVVYFPRKGELRTFVLKHEGFQDHRTLQRTLNRYGIHTQQPSTEFVVKYIALLRQHVEDTKTFRQMGWHKDGCLIGNTLITADSTKEIRVHGHLAPKADLFLADKPAAEWSQVVNALYNVPNGQPYQFAICAALGSLLVPILDAEEYNGIPIGLTSDESGYGKSTVCKIALAALGRVERNKNVLTGDEVSAGAVEVQCSTFNHIPHLFDEMTNKGGQETSHILYMLSNGVARARLKQDGTPRPASPPWRGISFITGNKNIFLKLTESRVNPEAAQMRLFEIPLENYPRIESLTHAADFVQIINQVRSGYGSVGLAFIRFVMANQAKVNKKLWGLVDLISKSEGVRHGKERFYIYTIACVVVAGQILKSLGLVDFNIQGMYAWAFAHMSTLRDTTNEYQRTVEEDFAIMLATFVGEGKAITTAVSGGMKSDLILRGMPVMRVIREEEFAVITASAFNEYCVRVSKSAAKFRQELIEAGCFDERHVLRDGNRVRVETIDFPLGSGVVGMSTLGTSKCYRLNYNKAIGPVLTSAAEAASHTNNVVNFHR